MKKITITTYKYDELSEEAKEKAIEKYWGINVDHDFWYQDDYINYEIADKYGLKVDLEKMYFDLDRGRYVYFGSDGITIKDYDKFLKKAGLLKKKNLLDGNLYIYVEKINWYGDVKNGVEVYDNHDEKITNDDIVCLNETIDEFLTEVLKFLDDTYNYYISREAVEDTIRANDFQFLKDGSNVYYL